MLSIIVCSVNPEVLSVLKDNVARTIGETEYEFVVIDNRVTKWPIAKAYNEGAKKAIYPNLLFAHEDIEFLTDDWGKIITEKLSEEDCGVMGFAGSTYKSPLLSGWYSYDMAVTRANYHSYFGDELVHNTVNAFSHFERVVTLDGLALFVRKNVWAEFPFDEKLLTGFHCYDIDFSMQISQKYKNYVIYAVNVLHKSHGNYDEKWFEASYSIIDAKWRRITPLHVGELPDKKMLRRMEDNMLWAAIKMAYKCRSAYMDRIRKEYRSLPFSFKHLGRSIRLFFKYRNK